MRGKKSKTENPCSLHAPVGRETGLTRALPLSLLRRSHLRLPSLLLLLLVRHAEGIEAPLAVHLLLRLLPPVESPEAGLLLRLRLLLGSGHHCASLLLHLRVALLEPVRLGRFLKCSTKRNRYKLIFNKISELYN